MGFYDEMRGVADEMIREFGQPGILKRAGAVTGDPWNEEAGAGTEVPVTVAALAYEAKDVDGSMIQMSDQQVYVSAEGLSVLITDNDRLSFVPSSGGAARDHDVQSVQAIGPAGTPVVFIAQCRAV